MSNYLDFLEALDRSLARTPSGDISPGYAMHEIAWGAGLAAQPDTVASTWTGQLVDFGYLEAGPKQGGTVRAVPRGVPWSDNDLQVFTRFRITFEGRQEAERIRRARRERETDAALGRDVIGGIALTDERAASALGRPLRDLRAALDDERPEAAVGAAKDLVESACKLVLAGSGTEIASRASLPALFDAANTRLVGERNDLGRSLTAAVQRLAELRNAAGAGHGHAEPPGVSVLQARLAASTACAITAYLTGLSATDAASLPSD